MRNFLIPKQRRTKPGLFLAEAIFAIGVLAIVLASLTPAVLSIAQGAQAGFMRNIAYNAADMYMQQILGMPSSTLAAVFSPGATADARLMPCISVFVLPNGNKAIQADPIYIDYINQFPNKQSSNNSSNNNSQASQNLKAFPLKLVASNPQSASSPGSSLPTEVQEATFNIQFTAYLIDLQTLNAPINGYGVILEFNYPASYLLVESPPLISGRVFGIRPLSSNEAPPKQS